MKILVTGASGFIAGLSQFYLIGSRVVTPEVGTLKYMHERFVSFSVPGTWKL
jgi:hypothetical protein